MPGGFNGVRTIINVPGNAAAFLAILAPGPTRRVEVIESTLNATGGANVPQGLNYTLPNDGTPNGFTTVFETQPPTAAAADSKPAMIVLGDRPGDHGPLGSILGNGSSFIIGIGATPATTLLMIRSATATATAVQVTFHY